MTQAEAKKHVCYVAANTLQSLMDSGNAVEFYEEPTSLEELKESDEKRVTRALLELIAELYRRG